jgi:hypothetical protein
MRCLTALQTCLALVLAFLVAPFEHVHPASTASHDHPAIMHAHFYHVRHVATELRGAELLASDGDDDDDHDAVWSVDSFTLAITSLWAPFILPRRQVFIFDRTTTIAPVEIVEERGHDPPCVDRSIPRAPPS